MTSRLIFISIMVTLTFAAAILGYYAHEQHQNLTRLRHENALLSEEIKAAHDVRDTLRGVVEELEARITGLRGNVATAEAQARELQREKERIAATQTELEQEMRQSLRSRDVTISQLKGRLTVSIIDRVMFDSGRAELKPEGQEMMRQLATVLQRVPDRQVMIVGHTDNVPIRHSRHLYPTNWELSTARATAAVRFLTDETGVDPARLSAAGYGEHHPIADNSTPEGRARNRRIDIVVMPQPILDQTGAAQ